MFERWGVSDGCLEEYCISFIAQLSQSHVRAPGHPCSPDRPPTLMTVPLNLELLPFSLPESSLSRSKSKTFHETFSLLVSYAERASPTGGLRVPSATSRFLLLSLQYPPPETVTGSGEPRPVSLATPHTSSPAIAPPSEPESGSRAPSISKHLTSPISQTLLHHMIDTI